MATPAWVAIPPRRELLSNTAIATLVRVDSTHALGGVSYGLTDGEGFLISWMSPAMFFKKRLCMLFSSMSLSLTTGGRAAFAAAIFHLFLLG